MYMIPRPLLRSNAGASLPRPRRTSAHARRVLNALLDDLESGRPCSLLVDEAAAEYEAALACESDAEHFAAEGVRK